MEEGQPVGRGVVSGNERTEQELFWASEFGDEYIARNSDDRWVTSNTALFATVLSRTRQVSSIIELGANIGLNLRALHRLLPQADVSAVEINEKAARELEANLPHVVVFQGSICEFQPDRTWDLAFTKGLLIHINPDRLADVYDLLFRASRRYILLCEYYNPTPVEVPYHGHSQRLFKRDFAGELLVRYSELALVDYGFVYHGDRNFPQDDMTWFLLEKDSGRSA